MQSIKPGRGPSFISGVGSIVVVIFGIFWTIMAASAGGPAIFPLFGVLFIIMGIIQVVYNFKNATSKDRYSIVDITNDDEEKDPLNEHYRNKESKYCPKCGNKLQSDDLYCRKCGEKI